MFKGFQQFILRGNVLDLAVAVVMGAAFGGVVTALVKDLLTPLIAAIVGKPDFSAIAFEVNGSKFLVGDFINALLNRATRHWYTGWHVWSCSINVSAMSSGWCSESGDTLFPMANKPLFYSSKPSYLIHHLHF